MHKQPVYLCWHHFHAPCGGFCPVLRVLPSAAKGDQARIARAQARVLVCLASCVHGLLCVWPCLLQKVWSWMGAHKHP